MKFLIVTLALIAGAVAVPPNALASLIGGGGDNSVAPKSSLDIQPDGSYNWAYETDEGIKAEEAGQGGVQATGKYSYISPEGETIEVSYVADAEGFKPSNLPVAPAIPEYITRALEYIASHPAYVDKN